MRTLPFIFLIGILCSCSQSHKLRLNCLGELRFRNSYNDQEFSKFQNDSLEQIGPQLISDKHSKIKSELERIGLIKNDRLKFQKIKWESSMVDNEKLTDNYDLYRVFYNSSKACQTLEAKVGNYEFGYLLKNENPLEYYVVDLIPGNFKEIILLEKSYVLNGDNYELQIFEISQ
ncbi:hypothetical protein [Flavobacterium sp.]|uniref:hypothetical protein n=1 Tax=Flavobacterium sp. TaxID=239 RepID=UPI0039E6D446